MSSYDESVLLQPIHVSRYFQDIKLLPGRRSTMSIKKTTIQIIGSGILQDDVLMVGESLLRKWKISAGHPVQLAFGSFRQEVTVISVPRYSGLRVGSVLARKMGLHANCDLRVTYSRGRRTLRVGPLISVLVSRDYPEQPDKPFGSITLFCRELVGECRRQGAYVYFSPRSISEVSPGEFRDGCMTEAGKRRSCPQAMSSIIVLPPVNSRTELAYSIS